MLQHPATDFYDLAAANAAAVLTARHTPPYSPTGHSGSVVSLHNNNNNNNSTSNNNNNLDMLTHNGVGVGVLGGVGVGVGVSAGGVSSLHLNSSSSNGGAGTGSGTAGRESLPSFGFTQEQVACVCEVSIRGVGGGGISSSLGKRFTCFFSIFRFSNRLATSKDWAASSGRCRNVINCN